MRSAMLLLFAALAAGETVHVILCYLRALKNKPPFPPSRWIHWTVAGVLLVVWFLWNHFRMFG